MWKVDCHAVIHAISTNCKTFAAPGPVLILGTANNSQEKGFSVAPEPRPFVVCCAAPW
jgi:hypothetical protein